MAIFTITNGESSELAVTKVTPIIEDCFTIYEYLVTTNNGDSITIDLSGNHYEAKYFNNTGSEISFSDTATLTYNNYLKVRFLLLNSGVSGVFPNATITITNNTLSKYYENYVERENDNGNCYDNAEYVLRTGDTMEGDLSFANSYRLNDVKHFEISNNDYNNKGGFIGMFNSNLFGIVGYDPNNVIGRQNLRYDFTTNKWNLDSSPILTSSDLSGYLPLSGGTMQGAINMDGDNILGVARLFNETGDWQLTSGALSGSDQYEFIYNGSVSYRLHPSGSPVDPPDLITKAYADANYTSISSPITIDDTITNGSINPVENNAIYDALQLKSNLATSNTFNEQNIFEKDIRVNWYTSYQAGTASHGAISDRAVFRLTSSGGWSFQKLNSTDQAVLNLSNLTTTRIYNLPDNNGTIALLSDVAAAGGGDMLKSTYDTNDNGIVDNSSLLEGNNGAYYRSRANHTGTQLASTISDFQSQVSANSNVVANTAKISNATHTGDVTGSTALTIANNAVTTAKIADNNVTTAKLSNSGVIAGSYTNANITVDAKGRITTASNGSTGSGGITQTDGATTLTYNFSGTAVSSSSSGTITANWVKTGKQVTLRTTTPNLSLSTKSAGDSGVLTVSLTNLPFTSTYQIPVQASLTSTISGVTMTPITLRVSGTTISGDINFYYNSSFPASGRSIYLSVTYITT